MGFHKETTIFPTDGLEYIAKITLQHKHTYGFCYLLGNKVRGPKPHPQALGRCVCSSVPSLGDRGGKKITKEEECRWWGQEWV